MNKVKRDVNVKKTLLFCLIVLVLMVSVYPGSSNSPFQGTLPSIGKMPAVQAVLAPRSDNLDGRIDLSWEPVTGAMAYRVFRAPLSEGLYHFTLLAELPVSQTFFSDAPGKTGSFIYRIEAAGAESHTYPLAARLATPAFGGLVPVSLEYHPHTIGTALASLGEYERVLDANTGSVLSPANSPVIGMVLQVEGFSNKILYQIGTMPAATGMIAFDAHRFRMFAVPLGFEQVSINTLQAVGMAGSASHSFIYSDGNNQQIQDKTPLLPGHIYGMRFDRPTEINILGKQVHQGAPVAKPKMSKPQLLGGSPDDGTQVVVLYDESYQTKLYKCWSSGKSGAWDGITDNATGADNVKNAAVVRRGKTIYVKDEAGMNESTPVAVYAPSVPGIPRQTIAWNITWNSSKGAAAIIIPATAKIGDYQVRVGTNPDNYCTVYVIFDPSFSSGVLDANEYRSWVYYDQDWQTVVDLKHYLNYSFQGPGYPLSDRKDDVYGYRGDSNAEYGADGGVFGQRWVEMACTIHGSGTADPTEACIHAYEVIGQRITWVSGNGWYGNDSGEYNTFDDTLRGTIIAPLGGGYADELDVATAESAALGLGWSNRLPSNYILDAGACFNFGTCLSAMFRALGIPGRAQHSIGGDGWTASFHVWAEAFLENPSVHPQDPNWWDSTWYEFDCNDPYASTTHTTSHSEGSITPIVINGYGDYLINEYIQCEGIGYDGSFYENSFECTPPGTDTGTHTAVPLQNGTTDDAEESDSTPLVVEYDVSSSAWQLMNLFVPYDGPASPSGDVYVYDSHHGYALNDTQTGANGGSGYIADSTNENDLPALGDGIEQRGVIGGWGFMMYRVPVQGRDSITVELTEGADKVEILGCLDRNIYSTDRRWDLDYDFISDANGTLTANTAGGSQLYLWFQLKGLSLTTPGAGQEVAWFTVRVVGSGPYVEANYTYSKITDLQVQFTDQSIGYNDTIVSWYWEFGDTTTSTAQNPIHTFPSGAYYDVKLTVTGASSAADDISKNIWIGANQAPTASFTYSTNGLNVTFNDTSTDSDGIITGWSWNFGDGGNSTQQDPTHTYAAAGTYTVTLTVTDNGGAPDSTNQDVTVDSNMKPNAGFMFAPDGLTVMFTDHSADNTGNITSWSWDFGDGNSSTARNAGHTYPAPGTYTVSLTVFDDGGLNDSFNQDVTVSSESFAPDTDFSFAVNGGSVTFTDESRDPDPNGSIVSWDWNFGDSATSTEQNPVHVYGAASTYTVTLTATDNNSLSDAAAKNVTTTAGGNNPPTAGFTYSAIDLEVNFTDTSTDSDGTITAWSWTFGDGDTSSQQNPSHTYASAGTYTVTLTVTDDDSATGFTSQDITVTAGSGMPTYCPASSSSAANMAIYKVDIGSFVNESGKSTYSDFTDKIIYLSPGASHSVTIYMDNKDVTAYCRIWIDYNRDGDFDDEGELAFQKARKYRALGSISVPGSGVVLGQKLGIRIRTDDATYRNPCDNNIGSGEVEDYGCIIQ